MNQSTFVLVDHRKEWSNLKPLTLTKPISHLRIGIQTIYEKWNQFLNTKVQVKPVQAYLISFSSFEYQANSTFINSSIIPTRSLVDAILNLEAGESLYAKGVLLASKTGDAQHKFEKEIAFEKELLKIEFPWDIFRLNEAALAIDFQQLTQGKISQKINSTNTIIGDKQNIFLEEGAKLEASILNPNGGYIYIGKHAEIMEGSVVRGSLALCEHASLKLSTKIYGATTIGPYSKVGGEVNNSVVQAYSNKGHDGFLGNSVIGEWCNLGADTNNSNLKNNYSQVRSYNFEQKDYIDTGLQFLGLIMGDHTKCGINTMFNTGTVTGVFANVFGAGFPPKYIPSFSWGGAEGFENYRFDKAMQVAKAVMKRRNIELTNEAQEILEYLFKNKDQ